LTIASQHTQKTGNLFLARLTPTRAHTLLRRGLGDRSPVCGESDKQRSTRHTLKNMAAAAQTAHPGNKSLHRSETVAGAGTDVVVSVFSDITRVVLSQTGRFGTWLSAVHVAALPTPGDGPLPEHQQCEGTYAVDVLLGDRDNAAALVLARRLGETVHALRRDDAPLLLAVALRDRDPPRETVLALLAFLQSAVTAALSAAMAPSS